LTGFNRETVKSRLEADPALEYEYKRPSKLYDSRAALPRIYGWKAEKLGVSQEKARLDRPRAEKVQLDLEVARGELISRDEALSTWAQHITEARARLLGLPAKCAPLVAGVADRREVKAILDSHVREALTAIADGEGYPRFPSTLLY
jgi:hypothetical protein